MSWWDLDFETAKTTGESLMEYIQDRRDFIKSASLWFASPESLNIDDEMHFIKEAIQNEIADVKQRQSHPKQSNIENRAQSSLPLDNGGGDA